MKLGKRKSEDGMQSAPRPPSQGRRPKSGRSSGTKNKAGHFVLIIGDDGAILVFMQGNTVVRRLFAPSPRPDHTSSIVDLIQSNPTVPISVLADVIDQQYVRHSFPPVSTFSVNNLVKRRMERDFQAEDLTGMLRLGRDKSGRTECSRQSQINGGRGLCGERAGAGVHRARLAQPATRFARSKGFGVTRVPTIGWWRSGVRSQPAAPTVARKLPCAGP